MEEDAVLRIIEEAAENKRSELDLSRSQLTSLPPEIANLTNLTALYLSGNQLTSLPHEITKLTNLTRFDLSRNQLTSFPHEITNLIWLDLSGNKMTSLPPEIAKLTNLTRLDISGNQLTSLPHEITKLTKLTRFDLSRNQLTSFPHEITNLTALDLSGNQLTSLPHEITKLTNLTALDLSGNQLTTLPPEIANLANLIRLDLSENQLTTLPPEIANLTNLTALYLVGSQLTTLPHEITNLTNLTVLDLFDNQLTSLPHEITKLTRLNEIDLSENPLESPPPEIVEQGVEAIFVYLRKLIGGAVEQNEAKLILVGQGDVGKTCLAKRLIYDEFIEDRTTEGIDILEWDVTAPTLEEEEIRLNVWDFGGQEIYHATHQLFLTKRSVYLLVWNARKSRDYEHIYYWLHTIEAFGGDSPIILVMSKSNERDGDLNMKDIRDKFPQIVDLYKVDSEDGRGIPVLKEAISQTAWDLPHMRTLWIKSWFNVRERLEKDERDWIEFNEFRQICASEGLDGKETDILNESLHYLGVIIHFRDRLELTNMMILKPDWATGAFYKVLDTQSVKDRGGILLHSELEEIWDASIYPADIHPKLLELMNKFELAYELPDERSHLVAELLPATEPEFEWDDTDNLRFYYRYDFLPAGVVTRFIVRVHQDLECESDGVHLCWREGAVLSREGTNALVRVKPLERLIEIKIDGNKKRELLAIIRREFDHINSAIKKVNITEEIPCNCSEGCPHKFNYEELLMAETVGRDAVDCPKSWTKVPLSLLLDGYERKENRMKEIDETSKEKGIILNVIQNQDVTQKNIQKQEVKINIDVKNYLPAIQSDFEDLKDLLIEADPNLERKLNEIGDSLDEVNADTEKEKLNKPLNKLGRFLKKLDDENSDYYRLISKSKKGIESAQKLGKTYNKFAQWIPALPVVPDLFLGD